MILSKILGICLIVVLCSSQVGACRKGGREGGGGREKEGQARGESCQEARAHAQVVDGVILGQVLQ